MQASESRRSGVPVGEVLGEVDHAAGDAFMDIAVQTPGGGNNIAIDLRGCPHMDSRGIAVLLSLLREDRPESALAVISPNEDLVRILDVVGLTIDRSFRVLASTAKLAALAG